MIGRVLVVLGLRNVAVGVIGVVLVHSGSRYTGVELEEARAPAGASGQRARSRRTLIRSESCLLLISRK